MFSIKQSNTKVVYIEQLSGKVEIGRIFNNTPLTRHHFISVTALSFAFAIEAWQRQRNAYGLDKVCSEGLKLNGPLLFRVFRSIVHRVLHRYTSDNATNHTDHYSSDLYPVRSIGLPLDKAVAVG